MPEYIGQETTTDLKGSVMDVKIRAEKPDQKGSGEAEIKWDFPDADKHLGYYSQIPELKSALHILAQRVCGLGYTTQTNRSQMTLQNITGWGEDSFTSIMKMLLVEKKVFGDAFAEIIRNDEGILINLKKLYAGDMSIILNKQGLIERYEQKSNTEKGETKTFEPNEILHLSNDRIGNEIHGTSIIDSLKVYIDFYNEMLSDERKIRHRELALGVLKIDSNDPKKIKEVTNQYKKAIKDAEVLVVGDGVELRDNPVSPRDRLQIMQFIISQFYQVVGTPKILTTSEGYTEAGGKAGLLAFEPNEISEKIQLEEDLWNQLAIKIKFNRAPSLLGDAIGTEQRNAGQTNIQQNETEVRPTRSE